MPPKGSKATDKRKLKDLPPVRVVTRSNKDHLENENNLLHINGMSELPDTDPISPVCMRSRSLCDLSAENSSDRSLDDSLNISHSKSASCLSPVPGNKLSKLEKSILLLSSSLQTLTKNVTTISSNMATKTDILEIDNKFP